MARFSSKRDPWAVVLLPATAIGASGAAVALLVSDAVPVTKLLIATVCFAAALFIMSLLLRTYYELTDGRLEVRHGPFRWSISISAIESVTPARSFASSAALSVERFMVRYGPGYSTVEISPADRTGFLSALAAVSTGLELRDGALVRRATV